MAFEERLDQFFETRDFAVAVTVKRPDGTTLRAANVIIDTPTQEEQMLDGRVTAGTPSATGRTADLGDVGRNYKLDAGSAVYVVTAPPVDDGTGVSTVRLRKE